MCAAIARFDVLFRWLSRPATRAPLIVPPDLATGQAASSPQSRSEGGPS
jgi:hypothetical protein